MVIVAGARGGGNAEPGGAEGRHKNGEDAGPGMRKADTSTGEKAEPGRRGRQTLWWWSAEPGRRKADTSTGEEAEPGRHGRQTRNLAVGLPSLESCGYRRNEDIVDACLPTHLCLGRACLWPSLTLVAGCCTGHLKYGGRDKGICLEGRASESMVGERKMVPNEMPAIARVSNFSQAADIFS